MGLGVIELNVCQQRDLDGRIVSLTSGVALTRQYGFDAGNRIISLSDTQSGTSDSYGYDVQDRLLTQAGSTQSSYRYDAVGNRTYKQRTSGSTTVETAYETAAVGNRLQGERAGSVIKAYSYLPSGQISQDGKFSYRYDNDGRLAQVVGSSVVLSNTYNALGQRVQKKARAFFISSTTSLVTCWGNIRPAASWCVSTSGWVTGWWACSACKSRMHCCRCIPIIWARRVP